MTQSFNTSLTEVAVAYAKLLKVKVTASSLKKSIEENSQYPSLLSVCDAFSRYNIENKAFQIGPEKFDSLDTPFIAYVKMPNAGNDFVVVTSIDEKKVEYIYKKKKPQSNAKDQFLQRFQRIVLFAEGDEKSVEPAFENKAKKESREKVKKYLRSSSAILLTMVVCIINAPVNNVIAFAAITIIKCAGIVMTVLLLAYEMDKSNAFVKNICGNGVKMNCESILSSKASKILGISWSELGFFYFTATTLWLLYPGAVFNEKVKLLVMVNALATPYILYSIFYQWRVVKQWCRLCLIVQCLLAIEFTWSIFNYWILPHQSLRSIFNELNIVDVIIPISELCAVIIAWYGVKPLLANAKSYDLTMAAYKRLQHNPDIFYSLLHKQQLVADGWQQLGIDLGNPDAPTIIIKVCNPYCRPCALAHPQLKEIIRNNKKVRLKIIFTSANNEFDSRAKVVKHFLAIAEEGSMAKTQIALDDWYLPDKKDYELFAAKYPMNGELKQQDEKIDAMSKWCNTAGIEYTPTIFINGFRMPENYKIEELINML